MINGDCIQVNTSANLCHLAYIRGLVEAGHMVSLLSADEKGYQTDSEMSVPDSVERIGYYGQSFYDILSSLKKKVVSAPTGAPSESKNDLTFSKLLRRSVKDMFMMAVYGIHGPYMSFVRRARKYRLEQGFDCVISLSTPATSHLLAYELRRSGHIRAPLWIQIWEDPWYSDVYGFTQKRGIFKEEKRLLSIADRICYVTPITLQNQKKLFPESACKMYWQPLPAYYTKGVSQGVVPDKACFGYFGDYSLPARDLEPFYKAAADTGIYVNICGNPANRFSPTDKICIYPRLPLAELKPFEDQAGVLVFLCNRSGGQIPGKIYQYSATDKTILFILDGTEEEKKTLREYFEPFNRFIFCENTVEDIKRAISLILSGDLGDIKNEPLTAFEPRKIVQRILEEGMKQ